MKSSVLLAFLSSRGIFAEGVKGVSKSVFFFLPCTRLVEELTGEEELEVVTPQPSLPPNFCASSPFCVRRVCFFF